jgi:hypothetical protein
VLGDDWDNVCHQVTITNDPNNTIPNECASASNTSGATAVTWVAEPNNNATIFTGGGSKDPQDINQWAWKDGAGGLPDKDNLRHAFAARYSLAPTDLNGACPNGTGTDNNGDGDTDDPGDVPFDTTVKCEVIYFGSDRFDNSGDAQQGFWFFQKPIGLGAVQSGGSPFTGLHETGDLLVISDFSNGGGTSTITVYRWDPSCSKAGDTSDDNFTCGDANLAQLATSNSANCATALTNDAFCGLVNIIPINMPWSFTDKSGTSANGALNGEFFEAGVNLSKLGLAGECFSSVGSETRSSTSTTATLKDFILGSFAVCAPGLTTQASTNGSVSPGGTAVTDRAIVQITGATNPDDPLGTVTFHLCGPNASKTSCTTGGTLVGSAVNLSNADCSPVSPNSTDGLRCAVSAQVNTAAAPLAAGYYCFRATADLTNYDDPAEFTNNTTECFQVKDTTSATTAQSWRASDTVTVKLSDNTTPASGSVVFTLYQGNDCTGTVINTFASIALDSNGQATATYNTLFNASPTVVSWRVVFTPTDTNIDGTGS